MLGVCYYASQLMGVLSFHYDAHSGEIYTSPSLTIYCAVVSIGTFAALPLVLRVDLNLQTLNAPDLHIRIVGAICSIRIVVILLTMTMNWTKRHTFMTTLRRFVKLRQTFLRKWQLSSGVEKKFETAVRLKFIWGSLSDIGLILGSLEYFRHQFRLENPILSLALGVYCSILNIAIFHYYFLILNINILLRTINEELQRISEGPLMHGWRRL